MMIVRVMGVCKGRLLPATALALLLFFFGGPLVSRTSRDIISTPSESGSPSFHRHLVRPGMVTTYLIRVENVSDVPVDVRLELDNQDALHFTAGLSDQVAEAIPPGEHGTILLKARPAVSVAPGKTCRFTVRAFASDGSEDQLAVEAETTASRKVYFLSIDSLHPEYLKLNSAGTGPGGEGGWLMPNLHRLMARAVFYPDAQVHVITATDMNHFNFLAGTNTGTSGIALVGGFFFGFDEDGKAIIKSAADLDTDLTRYGKGRHVESLFNAAKKSNPQAWTSFAAGKNWVPELMRRPEFEIDRIIHGADVPSYIEPVGKLDFDQREFLKRAVRGVMPGPLPSYAHELGNPAGLDEKQDKREQYKLARVIGMFPSNFPPDAWVMDAAITELLSEDPDVFYVLLAAVDDAGHAFGSAFDLDEWDDRGTPADITDDVSKYDPRASRQGILNVVREADAQAGRFLDLLESLGTLDDSILVVESDHSMITYYRKALDTKGYLKKACRLSDETDYFVGTAASIGLVSKRRDDPAIIPELERALEAWRIKNPVTGVEECPVIVFNQEEMKTGYDVATAHQWMLPGEYYSEYYIEHRKPGDQIWSDLLVLSAPHYKFQVQNFGLGNLGMAAAPIALPEWGYFIGGHGSFATRPGLLMVKAPGVAPGENRSQVYTMDVAPAIYRILGWPIPESVDGSGLPGVEPSLQDFGGQGG